jgi:hypothetical protein
MQHYVVGLAHVEFCRSSIGSTAGPFAGIFGSPLAVLRHGRYSARIFRFPERRGELANIRAEIAEMSRIVLVR